MKNNIELNLIKESLGADTERILVSKLTNFLETQYKNTIKRKVLTLPQKKVIIANLKTTITKVEELSELKEEILALKILSKQGLKWCLRGFPSDFEKKYKMCSDNLAKENNKSSTLVESILFEAFENTWIMKIFDYLKTIFPFNIFDGYADKIKFGSAYLLNHISQFLYSVKAINKLYIFAILPAIIGSILELFSENFAENIFTSLIPGLEILAVTISILSYSSTIVEVIKTVVKDFETKKTSVVQNKSI